MEKLLTEIKRLVHEYEERQREKSNILSGSTDYKRCLNSFFPVYCSCKGGECSVSDGLKKTVSFESYQQSLQDVNAAGQLHDSSGVEIINSLYKAVHAYIESEDKLKAELEEKNRELEIEKEKRKNVEVDLENLAATIEGKNKDIAWLCGKLESKNKRIKELEGGDKGEGKVDRFEAGIEKLNEIVDILSQQIEQKAVKSERDGGPGLAIDSGEINYG